MNKSILGLAALLLTSTAAFSDEARIHTTRDSGGYEASLREAGVPLSGGLAWTSHTQVPSVAAPVQQVAVKAAPAAAPTHAALTKAVKKS